MNRLFMAPFRSLLYLINISVINYRDMDDLRRRRDVMKTYVSSSVVHNSMKTFHARRENFETRNAARTIHSHYSTQLAPSLRDHKGDFSYPSFCNLYCLEFHRGANCIFCIFSERRIRKYTINGISNYIKSLIMHYVSLTMM